MIDGSNGWGPTSKDVSFEMLIPCEGLAAVSTEDHIVD